MPESICKKLSNLPMFTLSTVICNDCEEIFSGDNSTFILCLNGNVIIILGTTFSTIHTMINKSDILNSPQHLINVVLIELYYLWCYV